MLINSWAIFNTSEQEIVQLDERVVTIFSDQILNEFNFNENFLNNLEDNDELKVIHYHEDVL